MFPIPKRTTLALGAACLLGLAGPASAVNYGRVSRPYEVISTEISPAGDQDDYVFEGAPGFQLKASAKKGKTADLVPVLELVAPNGTVEATGIASKTSSVIKKAVLAASGRYALRVRGSSGTGAYTLAWSLKPAKVSPVKNQVFAKDMITEIPFPANGGALFSWSLKFKGDGGTEVVAVEDPDGNPVPYDKDRYVVSKGNSQKGTNIPIPADAPGGLYKLLVQDSFADNTVSITIKVVFPRAPKEAVALSAVEPALSAIDPDQGGFGVPVTLTGSNLSPTPQAVFFDGVAGTEAQVTDGTLCSVKPPSGAGTVDVVLANADGQVAVLTGAFYYFPSPTPAGFTPSEGPATGGQAFTVTGSGFRPGEAYRVRVGTSDASSAVVQDAATITCTTPAAPGGLTSVRLTDAYGQWTDVPGDYFFKAAPSIFSLNPAASPTFGNIPMTIIGTGFQTTDTVRVGGVPVSSTPYLNPIDGSVIGHTLTIPGPHATGKVDVEVRDYLGQASLRVNGLAYFDFKDASATAIPAVAGGEDFGGVSSAVIDKDANGTIDWLLVAHTAKIGSKPGTRLLVNNGAGVFTDQTATKMPVTTLTDDFGANRLLAGRMNNPAGSTIPGVYLSHAGTGVEATTDSAASYYILPWGRILFPDANGTFTSQPTTGAAKKFSISSIPHCDACWSGPKCELFDYDFRSVAAGMGDLDGDGDQDVVLVNDVSINRFTGSGTYAVYAGCGFPYPGRVTWPSYTTYPFGSAMRICQATSGGGLTDNTKTTLTAAFSADDDFRAVAATVADLDGDFLNDIVITWNGPLTSSGTGSPLSATRAFKQGTGGTAVSYKSIGQFLPPPAGASDDDWRGDAVAAADLNGDFYRDLVVSLNAPVLSGTKPSTRILFQNTTTGKLVDRTSTVLPALPSGDDARAKVVLTVDIDKDSDPDILISTPDAIGTNRRTRLLLNIGGGTFIDASSILPDYATNQGRGVDPGNAVAVAVADIDGDGDLDLILTDTFQAGSDTTRPDGRRTRVWRQDR